MSIKNLDKIFKPRRVAVIGASNSQGKVGHTVLQNLLLAGARPAVYPVNPKHKSVQGIPAYASVSELPEPADLAVICTPAETVPDLVRECGEAGIRGLVIISAGFGEGGEDGKERDRTIQNIAAEFDHLRILGPNCLGVIAPHSRVNASFAGQMPAPGHVAFVSQSGALCTSVLDWAEQEGIGFSYFVSIGNMLDVDFGDLIDYFSEDGTTKSIILYVESITNARKFMSASRAFAGTKPIVVYKAGRFAESAEAAASHTGAMAGEDAVFDAAFQRAGIERAKDIGEIFDCAELLARHRRCSGARLAVVTNAGGPGVIAVDALIERRGELAQLSEKTIEALNEILPPGWSKRNPVDVLGDATPERYLAATKEVLHDPAADAVLVILTPQAMTDPTSTAEKIAELTQQSSKPILAAWMGGNYVQPGINRLNGAGIPTYHTPEDAVHAFLHLVSYGRNLEVLRETPRDVPIEFHLDQEEIAQTFAGLASGEVSDFISEPAAKSLLQAYGIRTAEARSAKSPEEAAAVSQELGYPVVLKILSPQITHKTDVGGVALDLKNADDVREAFQRIVHEVGRHVPDAQIDGVSVQPMVKTEHSVELLLGTKKDPTFGAVILLATGGIAAELFGDEALGVPPLNERLARRLLESLRSWPLLQGFRGKPGVDLDHLIETVMRFSYLVTEHPEIKEFDINPLKATPDGCIALDARAILEPDPSPKKPPPYSHLAIHPYPKQYTRNETLEDGTSVLLRPIRPEDEPMWHALLAACTPESIHARFGYHLNTTHEMAARYCFIDYDREMAIVAGVMKGNQRELIGVGRLVSDPNHETAEYAILVADPWQGQGLGSKLTAYCLEIARQWGIQRVEAITERENHRMLATFRHHGFEFEELPQDGVIYVRKMLG